MISRSPSKRGRLSSAWAPQFSGGATMFDPALSSDREHADKPNGQESPVRDTTERHGARASTSGAGAPRGKKMNVSPLDLRQQKFRRAFRGFDRVEVTSFLAAVADD